jgi:hypothetical protein
MHDILRERVWRKLQALPQEQLYQVLDYIEFLEAKYAREQARKPDAIQKFAERLEDSMRMRSVAPKVISGTVGLLGTARRVSAHRFRRGREILGEGPSAGPKPAAARRGAPGSAPIRLDRPPAHALPPAPNGGDPAAHEHQPTRTPTEVMKR